MKTTETLIIDPSSVEGLDEGTAAKLRELLRAYQYHKPNNDKKTQYYEGHIPLSDVNLGIALPKAFKNLEIGCEWGNKCVDVLAARSMFDGYVGANGDTVDRLNDLVEENQLMAQYMKACKDELKFGCTFATLSADSRNRSGCRIRFHSPQSAAALWSGKKGRIDCGLAIIDTRPDESDQTWQPSMVNVYTDDAIWVLERAETGPWKATRMPHKMGRPLMEPMIWNATSAKPFGRSRIKEPVRRLIEGYVRTVANATIGLEFATSPQKYLLGVSDEQYDAIVNQKFRQYVGSILASTTNPETGANPVFGQLQQGSIEPHVQMMRILATQFSAATGLPVTDTGVINDANPTSSDAIEAQTKTMVTLAEQLNTGNGDALKNIALMAQAIANNSTLQDLTDEERDVVAHFKNPAMPSVASTADAATKIASSRPEFAQTDVYLEMVGFDQADIRRIKAQEQRTRGLNLIDEVDTENEEPEAEGAEA